MKNELSVPAGLNDVDALIFLSRVTDRAEGLTREYLYRVWESKAYEAEYGSWDAFIEGGLNKSRGWASKQLKIWKEYVLEGGLSPRKLENLGMEKLYLASSTEGNAEERLARASTWTRSDFSDDRKEECEHDPAISVCPKCYKKL